MPIVQVMNEPRSSCPEASPALAASSPSLPIDRSASPDAGETSGQVCDTCGGSGVTVDGDDAEQCATCRGTGRHPTWRDLYDREMATSASLRAALATERRNLTAANQERWRLTRELESAQHEAHKAVSERHEAVGIARSQLNDELVRRDREHAEDVAELLRLLDANAPCGQERHGAMRMHDQAWSAMRRIGVQRDAEDDCYDLELRNCPACGSTISRSVHEYQVSAERTSRAIRRAKAVRP